MIYLCTICAPAEAREKGPPFFKTTNCADCGCGRVWFYLCEEPAEPKSGTGMLGLRRGDSGVFMRDDTPHFALDGIEVTPQRFVEEFYKARCRIGELEKSMDKRDEQIEEAVEMVKWAKGACTYLPSSGGTIGEQRRSLKVKEELEKAITAFEEKRK